MQAQYLAPRDKGRKKNNMSKRVFSFDAETNGLWGQAFSIAAVVMEDGTEVARFIARCPIDEVVNPWVAENVLPQMAAIPETHENYKSMLSDFMQFYMLHKSDADVIVHMGLPVEARLFIDAHAVKIIGDWDAPYPLIDISAYPEVRDSVDGYNTGHGIVVPDFDGGTHNPLYDSYAAALCYNDIYKNR